jgi:hypothetical protein
MAGHEEEEDAGEGHVQRHGEAVGGSEIGGGFEVKDQRQAGDHEHVVHLRHVDLAAHIGIRVDDLQRGR